MKIKTITGFNTRVGVRCFVISVTVIAWAVLFQYPCGCEVLLVISIISCLIFSFQYPCGCEVVRVYENACVYGKTVSIPVWV